MTDIILSIHPEHAENILSGNKKIELRKKLPKMICLGDRIFLYSTAPQCAVVGVCEYINYDKITKNWPDELLKDIAAAACITFEELNEYKNSSTNKMLYSLWIGGTKRYVKHRSLSEFGLTRPPKSFCYVKGAI